MPLTLQDLGILTDQENLTKLTSGGQSFSAGSFIAPYRANVLFWFMTQADVVEFKDQIVAPFISRNFGEWTSLYYEDYDAAVAANDILNEGNDKSNPTQKWVLYTATADVLNAGDIDGLVESWGDMITMDSTMQKLRMGHDKQFGNLSRRHEYALIALPSAVAAVADALGYDNAGFDIEDIAAPRDTTTEEFYHEQVGNPRGQYADSVCAVKRAALWASLGEQDMTKQAVKGSLTPSNNPNKYATDSDKLSDCLGFIQGKWTKPVYCRVVNVRDVKPDSKQLIPCVVEIFGSEAEAKAAAAKDRQESTPEGEPPMPVDPNWAGYKEQWIKSVTEFVIPAGPPAVVQAALHDMGATLAEITAWKEYLGA